MNNIIKLVLPAILVGIGLATTGCVATRCYEAYPTTRLETTYVTPTVATVYEPVCVETPIHRTVRTPPPPRPHVKPKAHHPAPRPKAKPAHKAQPVHKAKPAHKAQPKAHAKTTTTRKAPAARPRKKG